jgi:hypothetical protein
MQGKEILPIEDLALAFSSIETIHQVHTKQLAKLTEIGESPFVGDIGKVCHKSKASFLPFCID